MISYIKKYRRRIAKLQKYFVISLLIFSLLLSQFSFLVPLVYAAPSPWTQTDWSGGSGQTSWSDATKFDSSSNVTTSTVGQVTLTATSNWYDASWAYRRKITFNNSDQIENLTNFPVMVKLSSSNINYSYTQNSGQDIRFTDSDGTTLLSYEIEKWDETGDSFAWVKVPQIDASSNTDYIYMYYANSSATDGQSATSVWDLNFKGVWHMAQDPSGSAPQITDSTSNAKHGTTNGSMVSGDLVDGNIGKAINLDGNNDYITASLGTLSAPYTIEVWGYFDNVNQASGNYDYLMKLEHATDQSAVSMSRQAAGANPPAPVNTFYNFDGTAQRFGPVLTGQQWLHLVLQATTSGNYTVLYLNGSSQTLSASANQRDSTGELTMGRFLAANGHWLDGKISEIRVSNIQRSSNWIAASYKSETDTFNTFASEEQEYPSSGSLTSSIFDTEFTAASSWGTLTYTATTPTNTTVTVKARTSNDSGMSGATAFSSCTAITSGSDISSNNCVTDGQRYIQYQISLDNTVASVTPTFSDISIAFSSSDSSAPSISLTALTPDPNTDTTPTISGTATEAVSTITAVQFQMDSTSGSWSSCTADDGTFDEASEAFTCTAATLTDGSHTMYVRATDNNGNTTGSGSESSDTFTIDATAPTSIEFDSPGNNSYTNNERPTFKWKATTDATAGLSKYVLEIDNPSLGSGQSSGDFSIDNIPTSGTTDVTNNRYVIHFDGFSDSDATNNYISVYTRSSSEWSADSNSGQNDGKLREGVVRWKVKAVDNAGNETSSSRTLFVDRNQPKVELTQINDVPFSSTSFLTTDKTPTIYGKITDPLAGGDTSLTQDENGPRVASGPKQVDIKVEKKEGLSYKLVTLYTINIDKPWYTCDNKEISDNSKQKCDKYLPFKYVSKENLVLGTYKITLTGKDKADNSSSETTFTLNITTFSRIITPEEEKTIEEEIKELPKDEQEKVKEELEITKPIEPSALENAQTQISQTSKNTLSGIRNFMGSIFNGIGQGVRFAFDATGKALAFVGDNILKPAQDGAGQALAFFSRLTSNILTALYNGTTSILAYIGQGLGNGARTVGQGLAWTGGKIGDGVANVAQGTGNLLASIGEGIGNTGKAIGDGYNQLAKNAPGVTKTILTGIGDGVSATTSTIASTVKYTTSTTVELAQNTSNFIGTVADNVGKTTSTIAQNTSKTIGNIASSVTNTISTAVKDTGSAIASVANYVVIGTTTFTKNAGLATTSTTQNGVNNAKNGIANLAFSVGEKTQDVSDVAGFAIVKFGYLFVTEPTTIANVQVEILSPTSTKISWTTNHPANGKVNYGLDRTYSYDIQSEKRVTNHEFILTELVPDTTYHFEVMSQNKNYVYDANREFKTPEE